MRYLAVGTWRATGDEGALFIECGEASQAREEASAQGLVVEWVHALIAARGPKRENECGEDDLTDPWSGGTGGGSATAAAYLPPQRVDRAG